MRSYKNTKQRSNEYAKNLTTSPTCAMVMTDMNKVRGVSQTQLCLSGLRCSSFVVYSIIMLLAPA